MDNIAEWQIAGQAWLQAGIAAGEITDWDVVFTFGLSGRDGKRIAFFQTQTQAA